MRLKCNIMIDFTFKRNVFTHLGLTQNPFLSFTASEGWKGVKVEGSWVEGSQDGRLGTHPSLLLPCFHALLVGGNSDSGPT